MTCNINFGKIMPFPTLKAASAIAKTAFMTPILNRIKQSRSSACDALTKLDCPAIMPGTQNEVSNYSGAENKQTDCREEINTCTPRWCVMDKHEVQWYRVQGGEQLACYQSCVLQCNRKRLTTTFCALGIVFLYVLAKILLLAVVFEYIIPLKFNL